MPANQHWKRRVDVKAPPEAWQRLGALLVVRRRTLGHTYRTTFERERRVNRRLAADIESAAKDRVNTFTNGSLGLIAQGYAVDYSSMLAVLRGEAGELVPVPVVPVNPAAVIPPARRVLPPAPMDDPARESAVRPLAVPIWERLEYLRKARRIEEPTGAQLAYDPDGTLVLRADGTPLLHPEDISVWDGSRGAMSNPDRAWLVADIQRLREARGGNSGEGAAGA